jgi:hypothetical protein
MPPSSSPQPQATNAITSPITATQISAAVAADPQAMADYINELETASKNLKVSDKGLFELLEVVKKTTKTLTEFV